MKLWNFLREYNWHWQLCVGLCILLALLLECVAFNHFYFRYHMGGYPTHNVEIPFNEQLNGKALLLNAQNSSFTLGDLDFPLFTVSFDIIAPSNRIEGQVMLQDDASSVYFVPGNQFVVAPNLNTPTKVVTFVISSGNVHGLKFSLNNLSTQALITNISLNPEPVYTFFVSRFLLMALFFSGVVCIFKFKLYRYKLSDLTPRMRAGLFLGSAALCIALAIGMFSIVSPKSLPPELMYDFNERGFVLLGNKDHSYLIDMPQTQQDMIYYDPYVKTLDALNKGQLNLDVEIDPKLLTMDRPYDVGARAKEKAEGYWDHSFYKGKYYSYYGYGPVFTIYYPIYWLTGKVPAPSLGNLLGTLLCTMGFFFACAKIMRFMQMDGNALLLVLALCGLFIGSYVYYLEDFILFFYALAQLLACFYTLTLLGCVYSLPLESKVWKRRIYLVFAGLCIVMIVLCRPHMLIYALIFTVPVFWQLFISRNSSLFSAISFSPVSTSLKTENGSGVVGAQVGQNGSYSWSSAFKLIDFACLCVPVLIGAIFSMYTNYSRFDSIFEFGQIYCTGIENLVLKKFQINLEMLSYTLYYYFIASLDITKNFPYVTDRNVFDYDFGNYFFGANPLGLFSSPIYLSLWLVVCFVFAKNTSKSHLLGTKNSQDLSDCELAYSESAHLTMRRIMALSLIALPVVFYIQLLVACYTARYTTETMLIFAPFLLLAIMRFIRYEPHNSSSFLLYAIVCFCALKSIVYGLLTTIWYLMDNHPYLAPDFMVDLGKYLSPITSIY